MLNDTTGLKSLHRREFVKLVGAAAAGTLPEVLMPAGRAKASAKMAKVHLQKSEFLRYRYEHRTGPRESRIIRLTGDDGSVGAAPGFFAEDDV